MTKIKSSELKTPTEKDAKKFISEMVDDRNRIQKDEKRVLFDRFEMQTKATGIVLKNYCN